MPPKCDFSFLFLNSRHQHNNDNNKKGKANLLQNYLFYVSISYTDSHPSVRRLPLLSAASALGVIRLREYQAGMQVSGHCCQDAEEAPAGDKIEHEDDTVEDERDEGDGIQRRESVGNDIKLVSLS